VNDACPRTARSLLRLPDALVLATADVAEADVVLTGDKRWAGMDRRIAIIQTADRRG
jgi:hypothetical protein